MRITLVHTVTVVARAWASLHTWGMPDAQRRARLAEIDSELWEFRHDVPAPGIEESVDLLRRVVVGMPDDVAWRLEVDGPSVPVLNRLCVAAIVGLTITLGSFHEWSQPAELIALEGHPTWPVEFAGVVTPQTAALLRPRPRERAAPAMSDRQVPDFSGAWALDPTRSDSPVLKEWDPRRISGPTDVVSISQTDADLAVRVHRDHAVVTDAAFDLSGLVSISRDGQDRVVRRSSWNGDRLITVTTRLEKGGAWSTVDIWFLSGDGKTMTVERVTQAGELWSTYRGLEPDRLRPRVRDTFVRADF